MFFLKPGSGENKTKSYSIWLHYRAYSDSFLRVSLSSSPLFPSPLCSRLLLSSTSVKGLASFLSPQICQTVSQAVSIDASTHVFCK